MRMTIPLVTCLALVTISVTLSGQCSLSTMTVPQNNGQSGNMFDLTALNPAGVTIQGFDVNVDAGTWTMEVYIVTGGGSVVGNEGTAANWTMLGSATVTGLGPDIPTPLPIPLNVTIPSGGVQGFYVTVANGTAINYITATTLPQTIGDIHLQYTTQFGVAYPFAGTFSPRQWSGNIYYTYPGQVTDYQVNTPGATVSIDNTPASACAPAIISYQFVNCPGAPTPSVNGSLTVSTTNVIGGWELALNQVNSTLLPASGGGLTFPDGQIANIDLAGITFLHGGAGIVFEPVPGGNFPGAQSSTFTLPFTSGIIDLAVQGIFVNPASLIGVDISQASEFHVNYVPIPSTVPGPFGDDTSVTIDITQSPTCWQTTGMPFYGAVYNAFSVISNGRVMFGGSDTDATVTLAECLTDLGFVGLWTDLNPGGGGSITIDNLAGPGIITVHYVGVPYWEEADTATFDIILDTITGDITLSGLTGIMPNSRLLGSTPGQTDSQFLGITRGNVGSTDPGATVFAPAGAGATLNATDMTYDFADAILNPPPGQISTASLAPGTLVSITFTPNASGNYDWFGL